MNNTIKPVTEKMYGTPKYKRRINTSIPSNTIQNVSFKSLEKTAADGVKTLFTKADEPILEVFSQHYGNLAERLGKKVAKLSTSSEILNKSSRFKLEEGALSIKEKSVGKSFFENLLFPIINIPLYCASWVMKKAQSIPALKSGARKIYNKPLLRVPRKLNELDSKTDMIKGIFDKTQNTLDKFAQEKGITTKELLGKLKDDTPKTKEAKEFIDEANGYIKESLYKVSNKFFDKHTGNYNTAYERPLNRIVSGLIPVAFLANDAYNLSVLCGDSKETSKKEAKERRKQEISRVFTTAYIQLLTFGAFTKQVNTIPWFTPLTSAATVLFSETTSRRRLGKPILFLSKDKAKEYNKKESEKTEKPNKQQKNSKISKQENQKPNTSALAKPQADFKKLKTDESKIFTSFKSNNNIADKKIKSSQNNKTEKEQPKKALINSKTFKKAVTVLVTGGFALSFIKNSSLTKNTKPVKAVKNFGSFCKEKIYNPLAFKDFEITEEKFSNIMNSLKESNCKEIAEGHEFIKNKYGIQKNGIIKMYKSKLTSSGADKAIKSTLDSIKEKGISLSEKESQEISNSIKTAINLKNSSIAENKFEDIAKQASTIISNKKINLNKEEISLLSNNLAEALSQNSVKTPIQIDTKAKPFVDIVTEPFKFAASAMKLPFKITSSLLKLALSPIENKAAKAALGEAELSKAEQAIHKAVTEIFGEKQAKSGKISQVIFANAMEQFEKKTKPYLKAKQAFDIAAQKGLDVQQAKNKLDIEKNKLMKYVNVAVEKSFNGVTQSSNKNTDLAMMSKLASSAVTSTFLVADNYNMVMMKSNGEDKEGAKETANERIIQRLSALFYQALFINWFNATFRSTYNNSLKGMTAVVIPNTLTTEILTRKSIGMPIGKKSYEQLQANEEKNDNRKGFLGKYFKFMRLLTGKKPLKDRMPKTNKETSNIQQTNSIKLQTTNLLEKFSK